MQLCVHHVSVERRVLKACAKSSLLKTLVPSSQGRTPSIAPWATGLTLQLCHLCTQMID